MVVWASNTCVTDPWSSHVPKRENPTYNDVDGDASIHTAVNSATSGGAQSTCSAPQVNRI